MRSDRIITFMLFLALSRTVFVEAQIQPDITTSCFDRVVQPGGWKIPVHSTVVGKGIYKEVTVGNITFTSYRVPKIIFLPRYYIEGRQLNLLSLRFRIDELKRLEVRGVPFAYVATVEGAEVGIVGSVWWLDRDGQGRFEEFAWHPNLNELPGWVIKKAENPRD